MVLPHSGTNFLIRSSAFEECGWSPEYTLTEDYALGMELTKRKWRCRYVEEYLAIGEAPEEVRNCFQQRSRWAKVNSPEETPVQLCLWRNVNAAVWTQICMWRLAAGHPCASFWQATRTAEQ